MEILTLDDGANDPVSEGDGVKVPSFYQPSVQILTDLRQCSVLTEKINNKPTVAIKIISTCLSAIEMDQKSQTDPHLQVAGYTQLHQAKMGWMNGT